MEITPYCEPYRVRWNEFVRQSPLGTCFHDLEFLDYHPPGRFDWHHLIFGTPTHPLALLPAAIVVEQQRRVLRSPAGATFGGFVLRSGLFVHEMMEIVDACVAYARAMNVAELSLGTLPSIYLDAPDERLDFVFQNAGFRAVPQLCYWIDLACLEGDEASIINSLPSGYRVRFRKALKQNMSLELAANDADIQAIYDVLLANKRRHNATPVHSLEEICQLKQRLGDRLSLFLARWQGHVVAFVYCIQVNDHVCYTQYIADAPDFRHLESTRFLLLSMLPYLRDRGMKRLDLGPSLRIPVESTNGARFKESLGAQGCHRRQWTLLLDR